MKCYDTPKACPTRDPNLPSHSNKQGSLPIYITKGSMVLILNCHLSECGRQIFAIIHLQVQDEPLRRV